MANYLTPEEEYELMHADELELMNDFEGKVVKLINFKCSKDNFCYFVVVAEPENVARPVASTQKPTIPKDSTLLSSPALSQISRDERQLAFTPANFEKLKNKKHSTPFMEKLKSADDDHYNKINADKYDALSEIQNFGTKRKRKLEDLFGDIYDLDHEDALMKKTKTEEEKDLETIQKILEARKVFDAQLNPLKTNEYDRLEALHKFKKENISSVIPKFPFMTLSKHLDRLYVRCHSEDFENKKLQEIEAHNLNGGRFFGTQTEDLWQQANNILLKNIEGSSQQIQQALQENFSHNITGTHLWVEKYCPKKYLDLLSDEATNRSLLQWIKLWDKVVFNRDPAKKNIKPGELSNFNKRTGRFEQNGGWNRKRPRGNMLNTDLDENNVPVQKIALLVGRPGLGKTTLAHVIAKHAGYEVREMNASDDRQVDSFRKILESCTQMKSVLNHENRPNCIVLDEIDGAPVQSVEFLIRFVSGQVAEKSGKKQKSNKKFILKRPIICICNDLYGANLRHLRQIAFVVNFNSIDNARLAERLMHISIKEHVKTDMTAMLSLAEKTGGDIRSCISVIQFYSSTRKPLTLFEVLKSNVGQKDQHKTLFNVWASIFQIQRPKKVIKQLSSSNNQQKHVIGMSDMSMRTRMMHVLDMVNSCGEYEKYAEMIFFLINSLNLFLNFQFL